MTKNTKQKQANVFAPEYPDQWTATDADAANAEGWDIFEVDGRGVLEIERNDCNDPPHENAPTWESDDAAIEHVRVRALQGSELHARALAIHRSYREKQLTVMVSSSGEEDDQSVIVAFYPEVDFEGEVGDIDDRQYEATKTISRDDAFLVLEQLQESLGLKPNLEWEATRAGQVGDVIKKAQALLDAFGGNTPDWIQAEAADLARSIGFLLSLDGLAAAAAAAKAKR